MSAAGDLRAVLSLDDFEYMAGMQQATDATDKLAMHAEHAGHSMHRSLHRGAHLAGSFAFMMSEGKTAEDMKSKLESLAMMAPMIGLAIGGWAGPLGIAVGIIGASMIPKLLEGKEAWDEIGNSIKESSKELDGFIKRQNEMIDFREKMVGMNERKDIAKTGKDLDIALEKNKGEINAQGRLAEAARQKVLELNKAKEAAKKEPSWLDSAPGSKLSEALGGPKVSELIGGIVGANDIDPAIKVAEKVLKESRDKLAQLGEQMKLLQEQKEMLGKEAGEKGEAKALDPKFAIDQSKKLLEQEEKRLQLAEKIGKEIASPYDVAKDKIRELTDAYKQGIISKEDLEKGGKKAMAEFDKSVPKGGTNEGAIGGSSESYKQIRESINSANKADDEKIRLLRDQLKAAEKMNKGIEKIYFNINPLNAEGIA